MSDGSGALSMMSVLVSFIFRTECDTGWSGRVWPRRCIRCRCPTATPRASWVRRILRGQTRQKPRYIIIGGVAFDSGRCGKNHFFDTVVFCHTFCKRRQLQLIGTYAVDRRYYSAKHMVQAVVLPCGFDTHHVAYGLHHTHRSGRASWRRAHRANLVLADVVAHTAVAYVAP